MNNMHATSPAWMSNILSKTLPDRVYRIVQIQHLLSQLIGDRIYFPAIHTWEDPFEDPLRHTIKFTDKGVATFSKLTEGFCGLCLSSPPECAAMWGLYGRPEVRDPESPSISVRLELSTRDLIDAVWRSNPSMAPLFVWAGQVEYLNEQDLRARIQQVVGETDGLPGNGLLDPQNRRIAQTLLMKRLAFAYEREFRLLIDPRIHEAGIERDDNRMLGLNVPCGGAFSSMVMCVTASPRIDDRQASAVEKKLRAAGFKGKFERSQIYDKPIANLSQGLWRG